MASVRQRMIEDMKLRGLAPRTQDRYLHSIKTLAKHYQCAPDELTQEQVRDYLLYMLEDRRYAKSTYKANLYAIKFLYKRTLGRKWVTLDITRVKNDKKLPEVLSREEVWDLLALVRKESVLICLTLMYTCGLRVSEAVKLTTSDATAGDEFGNAIAIDGVSVLIAAFKDDHRGGRAGSAYVYTLTAPAAPRLVDPPDEATDVSAEVTLSWETVGGANTYHV